AGPRVPSAWLQAISPLKIDPDMGCCGSAAFLRERVIIADVATDKRWSALRAAQSREAALSHGILAAWAEPLISRENVLLGTFAIYYREPRSPNNRELR